MGSFGGKKLSEFPDSTTFPNTYKHFKKGIFRTEEGGVLVL